MHKFSDAPGRPDGASRSRWRRHGDAPFGQPFTYTDATSFKKPGATGRHRRRVSWKLFRRTPIGWLVSEDDANTTFIAPVYDDNIILAAGELDQKDE